MTSKVVLPQICDVPYSDESIDSTYRKISWRLIPFIFLCYVMSFLDRINIGYAQLQMKHDLGLSDAAYGLGAGIFFVGYLMFEVPSNLLLQKIGARKTLFRIMFLWGITSVCTMFVTNHFQFFIVRFLLGIFEAGFFPGVILYLTYWYPGRRRSQILALFMTGIVVAGLIAGPVSVGIMEAFNDVYGLRGWQWLFVLEGLPSTLLGIVALVYLTDRPSDARWLSPTQRAIVAHEVENELRDVETGRTTKSTEVFRDFRVYFFALSLFAAVCGGYAITFWLPLMIKGFGVTEPTQIGLYSMIPYALTGVVMVLWSRHSDRVMERRWHFALAAFAAAAGFILIPLSKDSFPLAMGALSLASAASISALPVFWAMPTAYLSGKAAASGIAFINALATLGGVLSPWLIGTIKTMTGSQDNALYAIAAVLVLGGVTVLVSVRAREAAH